MRKWLKELWQDIGIVALVVIALLAFTSIAQAARPHLDNYTDVELCTYRAQMTEIVARYWNIGKRDEKEIAAMLAWHGDETDFEKKEVVEYIRWAMKDFIPKYIAQRIAAGKPASTLITYQVAEDAYQWCVTEVTSQGKFKNMGTGTGVGSFVKVQGEAMHGSSMEEKYQRMSDALFTAYSKQRGTSMAKMIEFANDSSMSAVRYQWVMEYINSAYKDEGDPWQWFIRQLP